MSPGHTRSCVQAVLATLAAAISILSAGRASGQELSYDDGQPAGVISSLLAGDIEVTRFTPVHPARVVSVRLFFAQASGCTARILVWADNGGNAPDMENVLFQTEEIADATGWLSVALPANAVTIDPPVHFYVGHELMDPACQVAWDSSGSDEIRSMIRSSGSWYYVNDGGEPARALDALIRATVEYFDVVDEREFVDVTASAGLVQGMNRMAWGDYDNDGHDDLLVNGCRLFRNNGDGTFTETTETSGIGAYPANGGVWADYDNDGHLDFYATMNNYLPECQDAGDCVWCTLMTNPDGSSSCDVYQYDHTCQQNRCTPPDGVLHHDRLWQNNGDGTFSEVSEAAGRVYDFLPTEAAAWGDYDNDGFVDLYVANYETPQQWTGGALSVGTPDYLWQNNGDGTFTDRSEESGIRAFHDSHCGRGVAWADHDQDGDLDIYVSNYRLDFNYFWENQGDGTFRSVSGDNGTAGIIIQGAFGHSIGSTWADLDNDGDFDLFVANLAHPRFLEFSDKSMLYVNSGPPDFVFEDIREQAGITYSETHSDPAWGDYDNDGFVDLFITDIYVGYRAFLYRNRGDLTFLDATYPSGIEVDNGWGSAWADFDNDGRLDLATRSLWRNQKQDAGNWLKIKLVGVVSNAAAIGAEARVRASGRVMLRQVEGGKGTGTQNSLTLHFGLGSADTAEEVIIDWPSGQQDIYQDVPANQTVIYREGGEMPDAGVWDGQIPDGTSDATPSEDGSGCGCLVASTGRERADIPFLCILVCILMSLLFLARPRRGRLKG